MNKNYERASYLKVGSICACIVGICYVTIVILALFSPKSVITYQATEQYFKDFQSYKNLFISLKSVMVVANAAMVGVIISIYKLNHLKHKGLLTLFSLLAIIGLGIGMLQSIRDATEVPHLAKSYEKVSPEIKNVILAFGIANPSIYALSLGFPGIWFIIMSISYRKLFPRFLVYLGLFWGVGNILTVIAHMLMLTWLIYLVEAGALIIAPIWSVLQFNFLWQSHKKVR